jgi:hypothetical protein
MNNFLFQISTFNFVVGTALMVVDPGNTFAPLAATLGAVGMYLNFRRY